jgi:pyruvate formate lyase activating enzyme
LSGRGPADLLTRPPPGFRFRRPLDFLRKYCNNGNDAVMLRPDEEGLMPATETLTLRESLRRMTRPATLWRDLGDHRVECFACGHRCTVPEGREGVCKVRFNDGGTLYAPWGYVGGVQVDPVEKKPFFHLMPGSRALSFGMLGCDYHCGYCQNWVTSQALRDPAALASPEPLSPEQLTELAREFGATILTSTYNEPLITSEWAVDVFRTAKRSGLLTSYVSNGNGTPEVIRYIRPWVDAYKVDLKGFDDKRYRSLGGTLGAVLDTIGALHSAGFWLEVVTLVVPGFNDSDAELTKIARFLRSVSPDLPWHVTAFHSDYKMSDVGPTPIDSVLRAARIGRAEGLRYVYAGNLPGLVGEFENTICPSCSATVVERFGFTVRSVRLSSGACAACGTPIPGMWDRPAGTGAGSRRR